MCLLLNKWEFKFVKCIWINSWQALSWSSAIRKSVIYWILIETTNKRASASDGKSQENSFNMSVNAFLAHMQFVQSLKIDFVWNFHVWSWPELESSCVDINLRAVKLFLKVSTLGKAEKIIFLAADLEMKINQSSTVRQCFNSFL